MARKHRRLFNHFWGFDSQRRILEYRADPIWRWRNGGTIDSGVLRQIWHFISTIVCDYAVNSLHYAQEREYVLYHSNRFDESRI